MLKSLQLENFTVFPSAHFDFLPGLNAFVVKMEQAKPICSRLDFIKNLVSGHAAAGSASGF